MIGELSRNHLRRDGILGQYTRKMPDKYPYDIYHFDGVPEQIMRLLVEEKFMDPEEKQNAAPSVKEFMAFMDRFPGLYTAHGYAVSINRPDYRVSIEGLQAARALTSAETVAFVDFAREADEFDAPRGHCWWD